MREVLLAGLIAVSAAVVAVPAPAEARGWNCWYEEVYADDIDINGDGVVDPHSGALLYVIPHCEVEMEEVEP
ncbi:MAG: hypothetical protein KL785_01015 [Brevundimonas sp.]|jgi:hypothetical protein|nr:hypothetical protein [Brevundimonas sp.]